MTPEDLRLRSRVKDELRRRMRAIRKAHPPETRAARSERARDRLVELDVWAQAETIAGYFPIHGELDPRPALEAARAAGKRTALPRVDMEAQRVVLHEWTGEGDLEPGAFGIPEPRPDAPELERVDLVLVPALAIDAQGHRIGWGKGFYDQLLAGEAAGAVRVGYVYDFQLLAECPVMPHDVPVQWVVTDTRAFSVDPLPAQ